MKKPALISMIAFLTLMPLGAQAGQNTDSAQYHSSDARKMSSQL